jgi:hypothetical protein
MQDERDCQPAFKDNAMSNDHGGNRKLRRAGLLAVMAAVVVLATVTACGGSASSAGSASGVSAGHENHQDGSQLLKLARCMRAHGVPSFPDPAVSGGSVTLDGRSDFSSPQFQDAERACKPLIPAGLFPSVS